MQTMRAIIAVLLLASVVSSSFAQSYVGRWVGKVVVVARSKDPKDLAKIKPYIDASARTSLVLVLRQDKTFTASMFNTKGPTMVMSGNWSNKSYKLFLTATTANGIKQKDPGIIIAELSKDGKTLVSALVDSIKVTKWVYWRDQGKQNGK